MLAKAKLDRGVTHNFVCAGGKLQPNGYVS